MMYPPTPEEERRWEEDTYAVCEEEAQRAEDIEAFLRGDIESLRPLSDVGELFLDETGFDELRTMVGLIMRLDASEDVMPQVRLLAQRLRERVAMALVPWPRKPRAAAPVGRSVSR
jgi:hypothetical protein